MNKTKPRVTAYYRLLRDIQASKEQNKIAEKRTKANTHTHTHIHIYTYTYTLAHVRTHSHVHAHMHTDIHKCTYTHAGL